MRRRTAFLGVAGALAGTGIALGLVLPGSSDPLHTVSNQGRPVPLTVAMRKDLADSGYDAARIRLYYMTTRGKTRFYRVTTRRYGSCYATLDPGDRVLSTFGCPWRPLGHPDRIADWSGFEGCPLSTSNGCPPTNICHGSPLDEAFGWSVDAVKEMRVLDESGRAVAVYPVRDNVYWIPHRLLPKHPCSLDAVDAHGKVLWDIHDRPEF